MTASRADVQAKLDSAVTSLGKATVAPATRIRQSGSDPAAWPNGPLKTAYLGFEAVRAEIDDLVDPSAPTPVPTPTPTPSATVWESDATKATLDPDSAAKVKAAIGTTPGSGYFGPLSYFFIEVARVIREADTPVYPVSTAGKVGAMDPILYVPKGTKGGLSNDQHLWIEDRVAKRWHDLDGVSFDSAGELAGWRFGSSMDAGAVQVPRVSGKLDQGATAALFPLARGTVTPEEIVAGSIPHALAFVAANLGPAPNPYPANSIVGYSSGNEGTWAGKSVTGHIPLGTWMRMDPAATLPSTATRFERIIFECLQQHGMFCRDRGSDLSFHGQDLDGGGASIQTWKDAGVALSDTHVVHMTSIPWSRLQVLLSPAKP